MNDLDVLQAAASAATGEAPWSAFLDRACRLMPNGRALLFYHDSKSGRGAMPLTAGDDESMTRDYQEYYASINPWMPHASIRPLGKVVQADDMLSREALMRTECYNDFLRPRDIETGFGVTVIRDGSRNFLFSVIGADVDGTSAARIKRTLQASVPYLRETFERQRNNAPYFLQDSKSGRSSVKGLIRLGPGLSILEADNEAVRLATKTDWLSVDSFGSFKSRLPALKDYLEMAIARWGDADAMPSFRVFHLPRNDKRLPLRIVVHCGAGGEERYFRGPECMLVLEDGNEEMANAASQFAQFYRLSAAEQRVVVGLACGVTLEAMAMQTGVSAHTVRAQLRNVFNKTGLTRQAEIAAHVAFIAGGLPRSS